MWGSDGTTRVTTDQDIDSAGIYQLALKTAAPAGVIGDGVRLKYVAAVDPANHISGYLIAGRKIKLGKVVD